jgi:transcriptional regulator of acetoin/glycerol metabolism
VTKGNLRQTAKILGISRTTLYNKLAKYKIRG